MIAHTSTQIKPRPVFCIIEHAHRDRAVAEDVCVGKFTENGVTLELGLDPDWLAAGLKEDEEWRIAWSKFYYGLDLASAYAETGEHRFQHAWERLVDSWIRQVPIDFGPSDAIGRRIQNWIYAWNIFAAAPYFPGFCEGLEEKIVDSLARQSNYLRNNLTAERNHRTLELYALLVVALAVPEAASAGLLEFAMAALHDNLLADIREDGVHCEQSTHYHMVVLRSFLAARENARRFGLSFPAAYDARLERACEFVLHCHRPDGGIPTLSDSDSGNYSDLLQLAFSILARPDFLYGGTAGAEGRPPRRRYASFPQGGYYIQRSGWGEGEIPFEQERFLIFDCGPLGDGGHGHYDLLNVEIAAGGKPWLVDPGRYTYAEHTPNMRHWFKGTAAHNTVCVDGLDQVPYRRGKPKGPPSQGRLLARWSAPRFDVLCGMAESPAYEVVHTRCIFFVADEYWIICDSLKGNRPHRYDLRFHLAPEAWNQTEASGNTVHAPGVALIFSQGKLSLEPGWIAPRYGVKLRAPVISAVIEGSSAEFVTLVVPREFFRQVSSLKICTVPDDTSGSSAVVIDGDGVTDYVAFSSSIADHDAGPLHCRASAVWWRATANDSTLTACNVQEIRSNKTESRFLASAGKDKDCINLLLAESQPVPWVSWSQQQGLVKGVRKFE